MTDMSPFQGEPDAEPRHFTFLLVEGFTHLSLSCAVEVLRVANMLSAKELFRWSLASENGEAQVSSNAMKTAVDHGLDDLRMGANLVVISGIDVEVHCTPALLNYLRRQDRHGVNLAAFCSGAYILAQAGVMAGKSCAVHWEYHPMFQEMFPDVKLVENAFCCAHPFTASGGTAGAELLLHLIAKEHGPAFATQIADQLVLPSVRQADDQQRVPDHIRFASRNPILLDAITLMKANIEEPLATSEIANDLGVSIRQVERVFQRYINTSPRKFYKALQLEHAKALLATTRMSIAEVTSASGFNSSSAFSKAYRQRFGIAPSCPQVRLGVPAMSGGVAV